MTKLLGFMARGSQGTTVHLTDPNRHPRGQLLAKLDRKHADKVFCDYKVPPYTRHIGYIVRGEWFNLYEVREWNGKAA